MMTNLFSVFDPSTGYFSLNWLSTMLFLITVPYKFWFVPNKMMLIFNILLMTINKEMMSLMKYKGNNLFMISLFLFILINNMLGLLPYVFTSSSHLVFSLSLSIPFWLSFMLYGWIYKTNQMFTHLVPLGTPPILMPFMVLIETISNIIRPGSLAVRLTANMIAGHLLMSLLGSTMNNMYMLMILMVIFLTLMLFELAVSMIQAYVFLTLTTLYSSEI